MPREKKKKKEEGGGGGHEAAGSMRWLLTYADCITLLLGVFIILASVAQVEQTKMKEIGEAFERFFKIFPKGAEKPLPGGTSVLPQKSPESSIKAKFKTKFKAELATGEMGIHSTLEGLVVRFKDTVFFNLGEAEISPKARPILDKVAEIIEHIPNKVRVEGHTCALPMHSLKYESNWELSTARACAVVRYFIDHAQRNGVFKDKEDLEKFKRRLHPSGYADTWLITPEDPYNSINRRIDVCILKTRTEKEILSSSPFKFK